MIKTSFDEILKNINDMQNGVFSTNPKVQEYEGAVKVLSAQKHTSNNTGKKSIEVQLETPEGATFKTWLSLSDKCIKRTVAQLGTMLALIGADLATIEKANDDSIENDTDRANIYAQQLSNKIEKGAQCNIFAKRTKAEGSDYYNVQISFKKPEPTLDPVSQDDFLKTMHG